MPVEDEFGLPRPPLPRPVRREAAIEAALRKFDGAESQDPSREERPRRSWGIVHRPHLAVAVSAALLLVVGIPAAFIGLRDQPRSSDRAPTEVLPRQVECVGKNCVTQAPPAQRAPAPEASVAESAPPSDAALKPSTARQENRASDAAQPAVSEPRAKATLP